MNMFMDLAPELLLQFKGKMSVCVCVLVFILLKRFVCVLCDNICFYHKTPKLAKKMDQMGRHVVTGQWISNNAPHTLLCKYLDEIFASILEKGILDEQHLPLRRTEVSFYCKGRQTQYNILKQQCRRRTVVRFRIPALDFVFRHERVPVSIEDIKTNFPSVLYYCAYFLNSAPFKVAVQFNQKPTSIKIIAMGEEKKLEFIFFCRGRYDLARCGNAVDRDAVTNTFTVAFAGFKF